MSLAATDACSLAVGALTSVATTAVIALFDHEKSARRAPTALQGPLLEQVSNGWHRRRRHP